VTDFNEARHMVAANALDLSCYPQRQFAGSQ